MPQIRIELHDSFAERLGELDRQIQDEITAIWHDLQEDKYYRPEGDDYVVQYEGHPNDYAVVCQHVNGWGGWQLNWFFEYSDGTSVVEGIVLRLRYESEPFEEIKPVKRVD
jgi:hypothetical protein